MVWISVVHVCTHCNSQLSSFLFQIDVVLRYDLDPAQRVSFIREAKTLASLQHEYIMKCYGVVIVGTYADSVGLVLTAYYILFALDNYSLPQSCLPSSTWHEEKVALEKHGLTGFMKIVGLGCTLM